MTSTEVLLKPKFGNCSYCCSDTIIRDYYYGMVGSPICFACWNASQVGCTLNSTDWNESTAFVFHCENLTADGNTQEQHNIN